MAIISVVRAFTFNLNEHYTEKSKNVSNKYINKYSQVIEYDMFHIIMLWNFHNDFNKMSFSICICIFKIEYKHTVYLDTHMSLSCWHLAVYPSVSLVIEYVGEKNVCVQKRVLLSSNTSWGKYKRVPLLVQWGNEWEETPHRAFSSSFPTHLKWSFHSARLADGQDSVMKSWRVQTLLRLRHGGKQSMCDRRDDIHRHACTVERDQSSIKIRGTLCLANNSWLMKQLPNAY